MNSIWLVGIAFIIPLAALLLSFCIAIWHWNAIQNGKYFVMREEERSAFKATLALLGKLAVPTLRVLAPLLKKLDFMMFFDVEGFKLPKDICSHNSIGVALKYEPCEKDVFVATMAKCGTTWMQQIVYEILNKGAGDLSDRGDIQLHAVSPWLESCIGIPVSTAPKIGETGKTIIKTHLPAALCPYSDSAKYIYVTRHPVSCFVSWYEFVKARGGPLIPARQKEVNRFCSELFPWGDWPSHVDGYWQWSITKDNVLFIHYEEMKQDLEKTVKRVAAFLNVTLADTEVQRIREKCSFEYMKENESCFEMAPPTLFSNNSSYFTKGISTRFKDATLAEQEKIISYCTQRLSTGTYPYQQYYNFTENRELGIDSK